MIKKPKEETVPTVIPRILTKRQSVERRRKRRSNERTTPARRTETEEETNGTRGTKIDGMDTDKVKGQEKAGEMISRLGIGMRGGVGRMIIGGNLGRGIAKENEKGTEIEGQEMSIGKINTGIVIDIGIDIEMIGIEGDSMDYR